LFDGKYLEWNQKRIKGILEFYGGHKFWYFKKVLDLGCGQGDIIGALYRLGADVLALDARQEHLQTAGKKFPGLKTIKADLDRDWPFPNKKFDVILDLGLLCHVRDYEAHLRAVCASTTHLILETAVCDSDDPNKCIISSENKNIFDLSVNGVSSRPTAAAIERVLTECSMNFKRVDNAKFNAGNFTYDWQVQNTGDTSILRRRIWFAVKNSSPIQFAKPAVQSTYTPPPMAPPPIMFSHPAFSGNNHAPRLAQIPNINDTLPHNRQISQAGAIVGIWKRDGANWIWDNGAAPSTSTIPPPTPASNGVPNWDSPIKKFVIVIPSYNNSKWCVQNINSALSQNYDQFRIIFTDDCSSDDTFTKVSEAVNASPRADKVTLIKNVNRIGALANLYNMIHSCDDDEIILTLDGDDWFPDDNVLNRLKQIYSSRDIWMTYGQYKNSTDGSTGVAAPYPPHIVNTGAFRHTTWGASHLRTFYAWLFKKINKEDLQQNGNFFQMTWDFAIMFPMLEMSGDHSQFLSDILYVYNLDNPINDHKVSRQLQQSLDSYIRNMPKYAKTERPPPPKIAVGLLLIATNKYQKFIQGLISSADKYFLNDRFQVTYYVFSDTNNQIETNRNVVQIHIDHKPFPHASMDRFKHFTNYASQFSKQDFLYYVDVDCLFVDNISTEILGNLVGVRHCGYFSSQGPYEHNPQSSLYVPVEYPKRYKYYFGGGFSGGQRDSYLNLSRWCSEMIDKDLANGITPVWHDETAINRYFLDNEPDIVLSPSYHYPQSNIEYYRRQWGSNNFHPKILLLDKNHQDIRG
jgi:glycosyltransferase involved in cell wall biosynthesis/SAM-dependent methyltransferase